MLPLEDSGNQGLGSWPRRRARMSPHAVALRQDDRTLTYTELADRSERLACALAALGARPGDRVALLGTNHISTFETLFACGLLGAVFVPLNTRLAAPEISYMLRDSGARLLVVGDGVDGVLPALGREDTGIAHVVSFGAQAQLPGADSHDFESMVAGCSPLDAWADVALVDPALLLYTSGTTGRPKAATLTHANLTWNTVNQLAHFDLLSTDRALCISPLFHAVGLGQVTLPTLLKGGSVDVVATFDAAQVLDRIESQAITSFSAVPTMLQLMSEHPAWSATDLSSLRYVVFGGSAVTERVASAWLDRRVHVLQGYGMTEAGPGIYMALHDGASDHPVSIGVPHFFTDVASLSADGTVHDLQPGGDAAELVVRGPHVFAGYWGRVEETEASQVDRRWFRTGDIVRAGEDGWAYVVDRVKDVIISGGENVYPAEVEAVATALDGVRSAAVVALPDPRWGEVGVVFVETDPGTDITEERLRRHLESRLARFKVPRHIHFMDQLPRNATGKVKRVDLREVARADSRSPDVDHQEIP